MSFTANLSLPYIAPAQAQKHITHNEALKLLDALVHICVEGVINSLPANPAEGNCFIINAEENLPLASYNGHIVQYIDAAWVYFSPSSGWVAWQKDIQQVLVYTNAAWVSLRQSDTAPFKHIGINTQPDSLHSLFVKGSRTLLDANTQGHRLKINKAGTSESASLVFQNQYVGHAELGLTGDNKFHIKVSEDGTSWRDVLQVNNETGGVVINDIDFSSPTGTEIITVSNDTLTMSSKRNFDIIMVGNENSVSVDEVKNISPGFIGQIIALRVPGSANDIIFKDQIGNLKLAGDFTCTRPDDLLVLLCLGSSWYEMSRSNNR